MSDDNINCHYVSRSLTVPWEGEQGELHFYDFAAKKLDRLSSKELFARRGLNTRATEDWLRDTIETPPMAGLPRGEPIPLGGFGAG